ncbi:hypothetical protein AB5J72_38730 [Streptomyces sp. CG1]|uniref:hypothetical protein n=1 Tax=Streptomyces sp. CG1 TaxID=1287523 RepID=UPI0034E2A8CC
MISDHHRLKGSGAQLDATGSGLPGPFSTWPADGDEDQEYEHAADRAREPRHA